MVALRRKSRVGFATVVLVIGMPWAARAADMPETKSLSAELAVVSGYVDRGVSLYNGHGASALAIRDTASSIQSDSSLCCFAFL